MRLKKGDKIVCVMRGIDDLTYGKSYEVVHTREPIISISNEFLSREDDICIKDDRNLNWWFGQVGTSECWTMWFITEKQWIRQQKLDQLI